MTIVDAFKDYTLNEVVDDKRDKNVMTPFLKSLESMKEQRKINKQKLKDEKNEAEL